MTHEVSHGFLPRHPLPLKRGGPWNAPKSMWMKFSPCDGICIEKLRYYSYGMNHTSFTWFLEHGTHISTYKGRFTDKRGPEVESNVSCDLYWPSISISSRIGTNSSDCFAFSIIFSSLSPFIRGNERIFFLDFWIWATGVEHGTASICWAAF